MSGHVFIKAKDADSHKRGREALMHSGGHTQGKEKKSLGSTFVEFNSLYLNVFRMMGLFRRDA